MVGVFVPRAPGLTTGLAAFGALATFVVTVVLLAVGFEGRFFGNGYVVDDFALYFKLIVAVTAFFAVLAAARWSAETGDAPEYLNLILSVALGGMLLVSMRDLFGIFVAVELATIPSYAMVAFDRSRRERRGRDEVPAHRHDRLLHPALRHRPYIRRRGLRQPRGPGTDFLRAALAGRPP